MIVASGFTLLKILNSFFVTSIDFAYGRRLFSDTIAAIRQISVKTNDLASRLAEVLAQLWRSSGAGSRQAQNVNGNADSSLQLKVKCRMSMSLVYDSVWRWREEFQALGRGNLDSMCNIVLVCMFNMADIRNSGSQKPHKPRLGCGKLCDLSSRQQLSSLKHDG